jgi:hypothetical protein
MGLETLVLHHCGELLVAVRREVDTLRLATIVVQDHKVGVAALDPPDVNVLVLLEPLLILQPPADIVELIQLSASARLEPTLRPLGHNQPALLQHTRAVLAIPVLAVLSDARRTLGLRGRRADEQRSHDCTHTHRYGLPRT